MRLQTKDRLRLLERGLLLHKMAHDTRATHRGVTTEPASATANLGLLPLLSRGCPCHVSLGRNCIYVVMLLGRQACACF